MHWNMSGCSHPHECNTKINSHVHSSTAFRMLHRVDRFQFFTLPSCEVPHNSRWYRFAFLSTCTRWTCTILDVITHSGVAAITSLFCQFHDFNMKYGVKQIRDLAKHSSCVGDSLPVGTSIKTSAFINLNLQEPCVLYKDRHTATHQTPHFKYFFNKYPYWIV
jgi:hypothetical protein